MKDNIFTHVPAANEKYNTFNLDHDIKLTMKMGCLTPTLLLETVPGDKFNIRCENLLRFFPLVAPVMHRVKVTTHYFFVPNRILWSEWEDFITGELEVVPPISMYAENANHKGSLWDYMGLPKAPAGAETEKINMLPFAAYFKIYNEYYRDQNLIDPLVDTCNSDDDNDDLYDQCENLLKRAWNHDYFTSCLPFAQKGDEVQLPLLNATTAPVELNIPVTNTFGGGIVDPDGSDTVAGDLEVRASGGGVPYSDMVRDTGGSLFPVYYDPRGTLEVDVNAEAATINTLRRAFRLQEWLERNARGGTRYTEQMQSHFGVYGSDKRLQRPEYIGGYSQNMVISEVLSTAETIDSGDVTVNPVGNMSGHGISAGGSDNKTYYAEEHGWIIGILNVQPITAYDQGIHRHFSRMDKLDYYWPSFANIGEQEVLTKEVRMMGTNAGGADVFGYIPRYSEYKHAVSRIAGEMRDTLQFWHLGRSFATKPLLNQEFIECVPRTNIFAVTAEDEDQIIAHIIHNVTARRKMPVFGTPTI